MMKSIATHQLMVNSFATTMIFTIHHFTMKVITSIATPQNSIANTPIGHFDYYFDCHHHDHRNHIDDHKLICHAFDDHDHCYNPDELNHFLRGGKNLHDDDHLHCHHHDDHQRQNEDIYHRNDVIIHHDHGHHDHHGGHH